MRPHRRLPIAALVAGVVLLAGCGDAGPSAPRGPYASPSPDPPHAVIARSCSRQGRTPADTDVRFMTSALIREGADLERVGETISGAVPGGDYPRDASVALAEAQRIAALVDGSNLCAEFRRHLHDLSQALVTADQALAADQGGLTGAQSAFNDLQAAAGTPPPQASPSP